MRDRQRKNDGEHPEDIERVHAQTSTTEGSCKSEDDEEDEDLRLRKTVMFLKTDERE